MEKVLNYGNKRELVADTTDSGHTGLHIAAGLQMDNVPVKKSMIQLLIRNGADLDARNREGKSAKDLVYDPKGVGQEVSVLFSGRIVTNPI
jgi:ankyrin repeat protein